MPGTRDHERAQRQTMDARLGREQTVWLATTRADGRPHLVPVWFVWYGDKVYICTDAHSQKMINMKRNPRVALAPPDTGEVLIIEGEVNFPRGSLIDLVAEQFEDKYGWNFLEDQNEGWRLLEIVPAKVLAWNMEH